MDDQDLVLNPPFFWVPPLTPPSPSAPRPAAFVPVDAFTACPLAMFVLDNGRTRNVLEDLGIMEVQDVYIHLYNPIHIYVYTHPIYTQYRLYDIHNMYKKYNMCIIQYIYIYMFYYVFIVFYCMFTYE